MFELDSKIGLYVPSTGNDGKDVDDLTFAKRASKIGRKFALLFGGSTSIDAYGHWIDASGKLIDEKIKIIYSFAGQDTLDQHYNDLVQYAGKLARQWSQECISLETSRSDVCPNCQCKHGKTSLSFVDASREDVDDLTFEQYAGQLSDLDIASDKIRAYWDNNYDVQTAIYENSIREDGHD